MTDITSSQADSYNSADFPMDGQIQTPHRCRPDCIMGAFAIMRCKDETKFGEYRTKRVILDIYEAMSTASLTDQPCQTLLDLPFGPPGRGLPYWQLAAPRPAQWPPHIAPQMVFRDKEIYATNI